MCTSILYQHVPDKFTGTSVLVQKINCWYSMLVQGEADYNILILLIIIYIFAGTGQITGTVCRYSETFRINCVFTLFLPNMYQHSSDFADPARAVFSGGKVREFFQI